jgi:hypothetical protein
MDIPRDFNNKILNNWNKPYVLLLLLKSQHFNTNDVEMLNNFKIRYITKTLSSSQRVSGAKATECVFLQKG